MALNQLQLAVSGQVAGDGTLALSGQGSGQPGAVVLNQWKSTARDGVMTGTLTYTVSAPSTSIVVAAVLDGVALPGVTPLPSPIPDTRLRLSVQPTTPNRRLPSGSFPGNTSYSACFYLENAAPFEAALRFVVTPIGADGREYEVQQTSPSSLSIPRQNVLSGCTPGATDANYQRPLASSYRLRVEYMYSDGVTGFVEGVAALTPPLFSGIAGRWPSVDLGLSTTDLRR
jgi:hypothetical protein